MLKRLTCMFGLSWDRILPPRPMILAPLLAIGFLSTWAAIPCAGQIGATGGEWRTYGGDLGNTRYSKLDQINAANFNTLEVAWSFKTDSLGPHREYQYEVTPLFIHGVLYATAGSRRAVVALDGATGELLWMHSENEAGRASCRERV